MDPTVQDVVTMVAAITAPACGFLSLWLKRLYNDNQNLQKMISEERTDWYKQIAEDRKDNEERYEKLLREVLKAYQED